MAHKPWLVILLTLSFYLPNLSHAHSYNSSHEHQPSAGQLKHLQSSLKALSSALTRIGKEKQRQSYTTPITTKANKLKDEALALIDENKKPEAQKKLNLAMDVIKTAIATLRNQETLIRSLDFDSAEDEYVYEQQRFHHYCQLVDLLISNKGDSQAVALRQQAQIIANAAEQQAKDKHFAEAVSTQEQSNELMVKAIRHSGIKLPG